MEIFRIQPRHVVDGYTADRRTRLRLPYPYYVDRDGYIGHQDVWKGEPFRLIGFSETTGGKIAIWWREAVECLSSGDPGPDNRFDGLYLVTADDHGHWYTNANIRVHIVELLELQTLPA